MRLPNYVEIYIPSHYATGKPDFTLGTKPKFIPHTEKSLLWGYLKLYFINLKLKF